MRDILLFVYRYDKYIPYPGEPAMISKKASESARRKRVELARRAEACSSANESSTKIFETEVRKNEK